MGWVEKWDGMGGEVNWEKVVGDLLGGKQTGLSIGLKQGSVNEFTCLGWSDWGKELSVLGKRKLVVGRD